MGASKASVLRHGYAWTVVIAAGLVFAAGCGSSSDSEGAIDTEAAEGTTTGDATSSPSSEASTAPGTSTSTGMPPATTDDASDSEVDPPDESSTGGEPPPPGVATTDDFDEDSLSEWSRLDPASATTRIENGALRIDPAENSLWFNARTADYLFKETTGDFALTAPVQVAAPTGGPPQPRFRLGGLMIRDPAPDDEDYVFLVLGADGEDLSTESKTTDDGDSTFWGPAWPTQSAELRICRVGATVQTLVREIGAGTWTLLQEVDRPDLPAALQFGAVTYANASPAGITVSFDTIEIHPVASLAGCTE